MCHSYCTICSGTSNSSCTECATTPTSYYLSGTTCDTACLTSYFSNGTYTCYKCNSTCLDCSANLNNCSTCKTNYVLNRIDGSTASCLTACL